MGLFSKWQLVFVAILVSQIDFLRSSNDLQRQCRIFMTKMAQHIDAFHGHPEFLKTLDTCQTMLGLWSGKAVLKPSLRSIPIDRSRRRQSANDVLSGRNHRSFRRYHADHFTDNEECKIEFFPSLHLQHGDRKITLSGSVKDVSLDEKSLRSFGKCCWVIFSQPNFDGKKYRIIGAHALNSSLEWGMRPHQIRSVFLRKDCRFPRG